jgi:hypothetical protein
MIGEHALRGGEELDGRAVKVGTSYRIPAFDVAKRDIAGVAEESSDAFSARSVLRPATRVIMVHMDEMPLQKRLVAHAATALLRIQQRSRAHRAPAIPLSFDDTILHPHGRRKANMDSKSVGALGFEPRTSRL